MSELAPSCPECGRVMLDDEDGMTGGWFCAYDHRAIIIDKQTIRADGYSDEALREEIHERMSGIRASGCAYSTSEWWEDEQEKLAAWIFGQIIALRAERDRLLEALESLQITQFSGEKE